MTRKPSAHIQLDPELHRKAKIVASLSDELTLTAWINAAVQEKLARITNPHVLALLKPHYRLRLRAPIRLQTSPRDDASQGLQRPYLLPAASSPLPQPGLREH